jgi:hypothetical protein
VGKVAAVYSEQHHGEFVLPLETALSAVDHNVPTAHAEHRPWAAAHASVDLQVPETLVRALLTEERDGKIIDIQVPEALLISLYVEGHVQKP